MIARTKFVRDITFWDLINSNGIHGKGISYFVLFIFSRPIYFRYRRRLVRVSIKWSDGNYTRRTFNEIYASCRYVYIPIIIVIEARSIRRAKTSRTNQCEVF